MNSYQIIFLIIVVVIITLGFVYGRSLANTFTGTYGGIGRFQQITIIITLLLLLVIFIFIWGSLVYAKKDGPNAPIIPQCPDFWEIEETDNGTKCVNVQNLGTCPAATGDKFMTVDFNSGTFTDNCSKYTWAKNCNIAWDGLTYGVDSPCNTVASVASSAPVAAAPA